jgi:hypothetical protein
MHKKRYGVAQAALMAKTKALNTADLARMSTLAGVLPVE